MDFSSNISLSIKSKDYKRIQAVYASQVYNTFFGVYANFRVKELRTKSGEIDPDHCLLTKINFTLINYKGLLNLKIVGFEDIKLDNLKIDKNNNIQGLSLILIVQHTHDAQPIQRNVKLNLKKHLSTTGGAIIKKGDYLFISRKLIPMNHPLSSKSTLKDKSFNHGVFDGEFYRRDGNYANCIPAMNYDETNIIDPNLTHVDSSFSISTDIHDDECRSNNVQSNLYPAPRCIPAYNKIYF